MPDENTPTPVGDAETPPSDPTQGTTETPATDPKPDPEKPAEPAAIPDDSKVVKKPWYQKKIAEQAYQLREAQRLNERLLGLVESNRQTERRTGDEAPKPENFNTLNEYIDAQVDYRLKHSQGESQRTPKETRPQGNPEFEAERDALMDEGIETHEDFQDVVGSDRVKITPVMANAILEADNRVEVAYFLGKNPKEANRISRLSPVRQIREIGRIEDRLNAKPAPKKPSSAPAPVEPVGGGSTKESGLNDEDDIRTWMKKRRKQVRPNM